jgi:hypothetical protein
VLALATIREEEVSDHEAMFTFRNYLLFVSDVSPDSNFRIGAEF